MARVQGYLPVSYWQHQCVLKEMRVDRFQCEECNEIFYFDMELEGMKAEPHERLALACPVCEHAWSFYRPERLEKNETLH